MSYVRELRKIVGRHPLIVAGALVLITKEEKLLLQLRTDNLTWGLLGGAMEPGETLEETARREVFEETGLTVGRLTLFDVFSGPELHYQYPNGDEVYDVCVVYVTDEVRGRPRVNPEEGHELRYFALDRLPAEINQSDRPILRKIMRTHPRPWDS